MYRNLTVKIYIQFVLFKEKKIPCKFYEHLSIADTVLVTVKVLYSSSTILKTTEEPLKNPLFLLCIRTKNDNLLNSCSCLHMVVTPEHVLWLCGHR